MIGWIKKHSYWALAGGVLLVAIAAIGFYAWHFRELKLSTDTGDWADFATYLSGTVGVAAVVATLFAFVITLRQQQKLIDSQDNQLKVAKSQLLEEEKRRRKELAYNCAINIVPSIAIKLEQQLDMTVSEFFKNNEVLRRLQGVAGNSTSVRYMFNYKREVSWLIKLDPFWASITGYSLTVVAYRLGVLVSDCLYEASELEDYFRVIISDDGFSAIRCAILFNKNNNGLDFEKHQRSLRITTNRNDCSVEHFWDKFGEDVSDSEQN